MSESILRALMQLFAIIAHVDEFAEPKDESQFIQSSKGLRIIKSFLRAELSSEMVQHYLDLFEENLNIHHISLPRRDALQKRTSLNSVKILRICSQINEELTQKQKIIVLIRIIEFIQSNESITEQELEFVNTVAASFNVVKEEYDLIIEFILSSEKYEVISPEILYVRCEKDLSEKKQLLLEGLDYNILILQVKSINTLFFRYFGKDELSLNGQFIFNDRTHIFTHGSTLRTQKSKNLYYSDVVSEFFNQRNKERLTFKADSITYNFKGNEKGLHTFDFVEESGKLIGIMGDSGTGKSTLLNVLNGNLKPSTGSVTINGINIHEEKEKLHGIIGFVSQDDLLIEELSVFQNLYFNAKLCFADSSDHEIKRSVTEVLHSVGLYDVKDLIVGNELSKTISGGQRKRLNIALELIREPEVLFVDEPTSGLSSKDSDNIMDLLKEMIFKGKLVFVVIHQPSSDIFKMFDRLLLIDQGGYPIYDGNPIDSLVYFKHHIHHGKADERECSTCGNVNPEQLLTIIDSKIVDEYGRLTKTRKTSPQEWNLKYLASKKINLIEDRKKTPIAESLIPGKLKQYSVFFLRDLLSKLSNVQYVLVTFLEAPILALTLSFFVKYFVHSDDSKLSYSFFQNENIPQYIFIAVIVSLFLGLTVAAEEIFKDKKNLKRESFLNLSKGSYLFSKVSILLIISAIQSLLFVLIGNYILEIKIEWWQYWLILFSTSGVANLIGLNISSGFNSAKVIYIVIPILIIPQLLFSGVIVKFDKLHPVLSKSNEVPWVGNLMTSRWAYEAIAVVQSTENKFERLFFEQNTKKFDAAWKKDFWIPEMQRNLEIVRSNNFSSKRKAASANLLANELQAEMNNWSNINCLGCITEIKQSNGRINTEIAQEIEDFIAILRNQYSKTFNELNDKIEQKKLKMGLTTYTKLKNEFVNEALSDIVTNRLETDKIIIYNDHLFRKDNSIYYSAIHTDFFKAHLYAPEKQLFGNKIPTYWTNLLVLWSTIVILFIALYFDLLRKVIDFLGYWKSRLTKKATR
jgi:ABC-type multidrug transport system ATPase subunit